MEQNIFMDNFGEMMTINREIILKHMGHESYRPLSYPELFEALNVDDEVAFTKVLGRMEKDGDVVVTRKNKYGLPEHMNLIRGAIQVTSKGYAFLIPDDPNHPDVFIYGRDLNGAMHNDRVMVRLNHRSAAPGQKPEGEVIRAITRANHEVVGTYKKARSVPQVVPDDPRLVYPIYTRPSKKLKVKEGQKVLVKITAWPDKDKYPEGRIVEVLGSKDEPGVDVKCIIKKYGLREEFPKDADREAKAVSSVISEEELEGRRDLRDLPIVTIDGDDAKDLDDAVWVVKTEEGYRLGVHIADVSHYVKEDSPLDKEAFRRGTSVYLVDRVLPMLPRELSNGICSLNPYEDRLAMSVQMDLDDKGEIRHYEIFKSVIRSKERMTYKNVNKILKERDPELLERYRDYIPMFELMRELAAILRQRRFRNGALDFDFPEAKVIVDEEGVPTGIEKRVQDVAENLIEEFMIRANEAVAIHLNQLEAPTLYRVHEKPDDEGIANIARILTLFNRQLPARKLDSSVIQEVLSAVKGQPEEKIVSTMILRAMKHARYTPAALGHFGLASPYYAHFTSPIRRYPDLIVHRALTHILSKGKLSEKTRTAWASKMPLIGENCTVNEMKAEEAERESVKIKMAQYMKDFVGEYFSGVISGILAFGFFVELENTVEGLVHISALHDDYYLYDDRQMILVGKNTRKIYRIGDPVEVELVKVNVDEGKIDFELAAHEYTGKGKKY
ncbi:MAG: ribonuclease R [Candidatus Saccharibacteria bacterium]